MKTAACMIAASLLFAACAGDESPATEAAPSFLDARASNADRVAVAMSGAPAAVSSGARIVEMDAAGNMVELRPGTNGWTCIADDTPAAPGDSPDCLDERWQAWFEAYAKGVAPQIAGVGVAYMLQGSLSPSNTDPMAATPPAGEQWIADGPHVMVIAPDPAMFDGFPSEHSTGGPYVMYEGTPYAHLMVPVSSH